MNGLFELDTKWKNIIDYDDIFLKEYETGANATNDKLVVDFLNDVCNSIDQDISKHKYVDPKPYIRLLENCSKEINKKLANNSLDSYKYKTEQIIEHENEFNKLVTNDFEPKFQKLNNDFLGIEKKLNKILTNNSIDSSTIDLSKGLLNLIQHLQLKLEKTSNYKNNINLLKHYQYFLDISQKHNFVTDEDLENVFDAFVSAEYKFEITELDSQQLKVQEPVNTEMSIVLTRLCQLANKLDRNNTNKNAKIEKGNKLIFFTKKQFETSMMEDFTLLYENLYNADDSEHDVENIYQYLNLIISLWHNMKADNDILIDTLVDMHPFLKKLKLDDEKSMTLYSSLLGEEAPATNRKIALDTEFHDSKFESFFLQILKVINKEIDIIGKIFSDESLFLETCNKFIKKVLLLKVKPLCQKIMAFAINNLQAIQYCKVVQSFYNFAVSNLAPITEVFKFVDHDVETFVKEELLSNFDKKQFQVYLNKALNLLATNYLKNITTQQLPPSSLNDLKILLKKNEKKNYKSVLGDLNNSFDTVQAESSEETQTNLLNAFGQKTLTQFNSLLKHTELNSSEHSIGNGETGGQSSGFSSFRSMSPSINSSKENLNTENFSIFKLLESLVYLFAIQKDLFSSEDFETNKQQLLINLNTLLDNYFIRNFEIFFYYYKNNLLSGLNALSSLMLKQKAQLQLYYKSLMSLFNIKEHMIDFRLLDKIETTINIIYVQIVLEFNDCITKALKLQSKKDYIITNSNKKRHGDHAEPTESFRIILNALANILNQFDENKNLNSLLEILLDNLYKLLLKNYKKFDVNQAGGLVMNNDIVNLYNLVEPFQTTIISSATLYNFRLLKELVAIFTMNDLNSVRYLVENSIYLKKKTGLNLNEYIKKRV